MNIFETEIRILNAGEGGENKTSIIHIERKLCEELLGMTFGNVHHVEIARVRLFDVHLMSHS